ncbi:MAG: YbhB/YbcL family Raf kinase inhibitor-like protein [Raoultibacter sp.]|jgi:Raf kinase inhibitor-like YbhB/YbcL family protein
MRIQIELENGMLADKYGKYAPEEHYFEGNPTLSFPFHIADIPAGTKTLALTFLDWDSIPVCGFCWIHWTACNIAANTSFVPENASLSGQIPMTQGLNSDCSSFVGNYSDPRVICRYAGPCPPDKDHRYTLTLYALDTELDLQEGFYLNELLKAMEGHILASAAQHVMSRA